MNNKRVLLQRLWVSFDLLRGAGVGLEEYFPLAILGFYSSIDSNKANLEKYITGEVGVEEYLDILLRDSQYKPRIMTSMQNERVYRDFFASFVPAFNADDNKVESSQVLLDHISKASGKGSVEYFTPIVVKNLICNLVGIENVKSIYDPCFGISSILSKKLSGEVEVYGHEINHDICELAKLYLESVGMKKHRLVNLDPIVGLERDYEYKKEQFDLCVSIPPFGLRTSRKEFRDPRGRFSNGIVSRDLGLNFIEHGLYSVSEQGTVAMVVANSCLTRKSTEREIIKRLVETNKIESVISLPAGIFYSTNLLTSIIILRKNRSSKDSIKLINASTLEVSKKEGIDERFFDSVVSDFHKKENYSSLTRDISIEEIISNDYSLLPSKYIYEEEPLDFRLNSEEILEDLKIGHIELEKKFSKIFENKDYK